MFSLRVSNTTFLMCLISLAASLWDPVEIFVYSDFALTRELIGASIMPALLWAGSTVIEWNYQIKKLGIPIPWES